MTDESPESPDTDISMAAIIKRLAAAQEELDALTAEAQDDQKEEDLKIVSYEDKEYDFCFKYL